MSVHAMSWVLRNSDARQGDRLVLLALADYAGEDGTNAWPSHKTLARDSRLTERQVQRCLKRLEAAGRIERTGVSEFGTVVYRILMETPAQGGDRMSGGGDIRVTGGVTSTTEMVSQMSPEPPLEPPIPTTANAVVGTTRARERWTVDRRDVTDAEDALATEVLAAWNHLTEQSLTSRDWLRKIVMRIREYPALTIDDHERIIRAALAHPWWRGPTSPSVVYGSGAQFERSILEARSPGSDGRRGPSAEAAARIAADQMERRERDEPAPLRRGIESRVSPS